MSTQLALYLPAVGSRAERRQSPLADSAGKAGTAGLDERFAAWLECNKNLVSAFCAKALELKRSGREHYGAKRIAEQLRYDTTLRQAEDGSGAKLNNNMVSRLARVAIQRHPELAGFFALRRIQGE